MVLQTGLFNIAQSTEFIYWLIDLFFIIISHLYLGYLQTRGDRGSTVVKVLCYKSEGRWFDPS